MKKIELLSEGGWLMDQISDGKTNREIAAQAGCSPCTVMRALNRRGFGINPHVDRSLAKKVARRHTYDTSVLEAIDTEEQAYVLGFIAADGYVNRWGLVIQLHCKDVDILESIRRIFKASVDIKSHGNGKFRALAVYDVNLVEQLRKLGIVRAKSAIVPFARGVPQQLIHHYLRGVMDGDGSIGRQARLVTGSEQFYRGFVHWFSVQYTSPLWHRQEGNKYRIVFNRCNSEFLHDLYSKASVAGRRRMASYMEHWYNR